MKYLLFLMMCIPLMIHAQEENSGIKFEHGLSWEQVKAKAKAENKYVFVDAYTTWCVPCKKMDKEVYPNDTIGQFMNDKFISIKVQMDSTGKDNEQVKRWYNDARAIEQEYRIEGFPSFLFFNPKGMLIYKDLGYKNVPDFLNLVNNAMDTQNILYYTLLEDYKSGNKNYGEMYKLIKFVKNTLGDDELAKEMAVEYITNVDKKQLLAIEKIYLVLNVARNRKLADSLAKVYINDYLNKLSDEEFCIEENVYFINYFNHLLTSRDKFFQLAYAKPEKIDSAANFKGFANSFLQSTIMTEEIISRLFKNGKPIFKNPDWNGISTIIKEKYPKVHVKELILNYQRIYYSQLKDCTQWAKYQGEIIKSYRAKPAGTEIFSELNAFGAWDAFLNCNDERVLTKALEWIDLAIKLAESDANANIMAFLDTRANVLYKLGRVKEAIAQEEKAVEAGLARSKQEDVNLQSLMPAINRYKKVIEKMKKGEPTYTEQRAVWDDKTLQKIHSRRKASPTK